MQKYNRRTGSYGRLKRGFTCRRTAIGCVMKRKRSTFRIYVPRSPLANRWKKAAWKCFSFSIARERLQRFARGYEFRNSHRWCSITILADSRVTLGSPWSGAILSAALFPNLPCSPSSPNGCARTFRFCSRQPHQANHLHSRPRRALACRCLNCCR
jgi:hypothetical protein